MFRNSLIFVIFAVGLCSAIEFYNYTRKDKITDLAVHGDIIWATTSGGVVKYDTTGKILDTYTNADGLNYIGQSHVAVDSSGVVWFGTYDGISTFDGKSWGIYDITKPLITADIKVIEVGSDERVWVGTYDDTFVFDGEKWRKYNISAQDIEIGDNDSIWVVPVGLRGLIMLYDNSWTVYDTSNSGLISNEVNGIAVDSNGVWIGLGDFYGPGGLQYFDGDTWTLYDTSNSELPDNSVYEIEIDENGAKWLSVGWDNMVKFDEEGWRTYNHENSPINSRFNSFAFGPDNAVLFFGGKGICRLSDTTWFSFPVSVDLPRNYVKCAAVEEDNTKWFGTNRGVAKYNKGKWTTYLSGTSLIAGNILSIAVDKNNVKWFGEDIDGYAISSFDGSDWDNYNMWGKKSWVTHYVHAIAVDCTNVKWFGSDNTIWPSAKKWWGTGATSFDGQTWTRYDTSNSEILDDVVRAIGVDSDNTKWFGTEKGISTYNGSKWTTYDTANSGLCNNSIRDITIDSEGTVWLGTEDGLSSFDGAQWSSYCDKIPGGDITAVAVKKDGTKLIGTQYGGLTIFKDTTWTTYREPDGLADDQIEDIVVDNKGTSWICTGNGISRFGGPPVIKAKHMNVRSFHTKDISVLYKCPYLTLDYELDDHSQVQIALYTIRGRCIRSADFHSTAGEHKKTWNVEDLPNGNYILQVKGNQFEANKKIIKNR